MAPSLPKAVKGLRGAMLRLGTRSMTRVLPKQANLVLFGARNGDWYMDNSQHLFEWTLQHRPDLRAVWITRNRDVYKTLKENNKPVAMTTSLEGIYLLLKASTAVISNRLTDIALAESLVPDSLEVISLGHGQGVKGKRGAIKNKEVAAQWAKELKRPTELTKYAVATSPLVAKMTADSHLLPLERVVVTGYPRNDYLLDPPPEAKREWSDYLGGVEPSRVLLYAPTWRQEREPTRFFPFGDFDKTQLLCFLREHKLLLLLRPHVKDLVDYPSLREFLEDLASDDSVVRLATHHDFPDVNHFLPFVDVLLTDYSSLYHDFLLLDRPLMFVPYDYADFQRENGFVYDYYENLPGPAITSLAEFCAYLKQLTDGEDPHKGKREALRDKIHTHQDAQSCARVTALIDRSLKRTQ